MTLAVDRAVKPQHKQTNQSIRVCCFPTLVVVFPNDFLSDYFDVFRFIRIALWSSAWKELSSWLSAWRVLFSAVLIVCAPLGQNVEFDCIDSRPFPFHLLYLRKECYHFMM